MGKGLDSRLGSREMVTDGELFSCCVYQGGAGQARLSLPAFGSAQGLGTPGADVVRLPDCRPAGEESPVSLP